MKKALIIGISGQDGAYLSRLLLEKGYEVYGTSRDAEISRFEALRFVNVHKRVQLFSMSLTDFRSILQGLTRTRPDEVYNLAGQSSVGLSFQQPVETFESIAIGTLNLLEAIRFLGKEVRFYNAGSVECFGNADALVTEASPHQPVSPYGVAKSAAFWQVANYRQAYGLFACSGLLSNHESPLRPERFVTRKDYQYRMPHRARQHRDTYVGKHRDCSRLGMGARICGCHVAHFAIRRTGRLCHRNR